MAISIVIVGAGLGREFGFPDGIELKALIRGYLQPHERDLAEIIQWGSFDTVDEIAKAYPHQANRLRQIVITILRKRENPDSLNQEKGINTYGLLLRQIAKARENGDTVYVYTFNYDRSLQFLLHRFNSIRDEISKIPPDIIRPVYGRLAPMYFEKSKTDFRRYDHDEYGSGSEPSIRMISNSTYLDAFSDDNMLAEANLLRIDDLRRQSNVSFIGEANGPRIEDAKANLESAQQIILLGVGYHRANMDIFDFDFRKKWHDKVIVGTGYKLEEGKPAAILDEYQAISRLDPCDARTFLSTRFDLADVNKNVQKLAKQQAAR